MTTSQQQPPHNADKSADDDVSPQQQQQQQPQQQPPKMPTPASPVSVAHDEEDASPAPAAAAAAAAAEGTLTLRNVQVRIQKRPTAEGGEEQHEAFALEALVLPEAPTLQDVRTALTNCELGDPVRDIFFPAWTKSLYIECAGEATTVESDAQLQDVLAREAAAPGSVTLLLQECRNARYSRRKRAAYRLGAGRPWSAGVGVGVPYRVDLPIYYDRPLPYYSYAAAYPAPHELAAFIPPHYMLPYLYAPQH